MKKRILIFLMVFSVFFIGLGGMNQVSADGTLTKNIKARTKQGGNPLTKIGKTGAIPAEYGTFGFFKYTGDYKPIYSGVTAPSKAVKNEWASYSKKDTTWESTFTVGEKKPTIAKKNYSICVPHAAIYNGKWIDIKGTVINFEKSTNKSYEKTNKNRKPTISFTANKNSKRISVNVQAVNWVGVKWSFTEFNGKCTGKSISVKGNTSYRDVDYQQGIRLQDSSNKGIYITNSKNKLRYGNVAAGSTTKRHIFDKANSNALPSYDSFAFTETFSGSSITRYYTFVRNADGKARGGIGMEYNSFNPITPENPKKSRTLDIVAEGLDQVYTVSQNIPNQDKSNYHKSVIIKDTLDNCYDMNSTTYKITREDGKNATNYFTIKKDGQTVTATATKDALKKEDFYGATYKLVITTKLKNNYDFSKYEKDEKGYIIKNKGTSIIDNKERTTNEVISHYELPSEITKPSKLVSAESIRENKEFYYGIWNYAPSVNEGQYYKEYVITDELEAPLKVTDQSKIKVYLSPFPKISNADASSEITSMFDIKVSGQNITLTLKNPNDPSFYVKNTNIEKIGIKGYIVLIPVALKENVKSLVDMNKYQKEGKYVIPNVSKLHVTKHDGTKVEKQTNEVEVYYEEDLPAQKSVDIENITDIHEKNGIYTYTIEKDVRNYSESQYYTSFVMQDKFEDCIKIKDTSSIKIINEEGKDVTNWFDLKLSNNLLTASLKQANNNANFYGHTYKFNITASIPSNANLNKYLKNDQYVIPNKATFIYDNTKKIETNNVDVIIDVPEVKKVEKSVKAPNTASPSTIGAIVAGLIAIAIAGYLLITQAKNNPLKQIKK